MTECEASAQPDELRAKRSALYADCQRLTVELPNIRAAFGNPFSFSNPADPGDRSC